MARKTKKMALVEALAFDAAQPANLSPQMVKTLADHDKRFHKKGWKPGDKCKFRDNINLGKATSEYDDELDYLKDAAEKIRTAAKHVNRSISNPSYSYNQSDLDVVDDLNDVISDIGKRDAQAKELAERIAEIQAFRKGGASALANGKVGKARHYHSSQYQFPAAQNVQPQQAATPPPAQKPASSASSTSQQDQSLPATIDSISFNSDGSAVVTIGGQQYPMASAGGLSGVVSGQLPGADGAMHNVFLKHTFKGLTKDALQNEHLADTLTRMAGFNSPAGKMYDVGNDKIKATLAVDNVIGNIGDVLDDPNTPQAAKDKVHEQMRAIYPLQAMMYNTDQNKYGILVDKNYDVHFIDNGSAFMYRGSGDLKDSSYKISHGSKQPWQGGNFVDRADATPGATDSNGNPTGIEALYNAQSRWQKYCGPYSPQDMLDNAKKIDFQKLYDEAAKVKGGTQDQGLPTAAGDIPNLKKWVDSLSAAAPFSGAAKGTQASPGGQTTSQQQPAAQPKQSGKSKQSGPLNANQQTDLRTKEANARAAIHLLTSQMKSAPAALQSVYKTALAAAKKDLSDAHTEMRKNGMNINSSEVLDLGKGALMEDGDTGKTLNQRRKADGLPELKALDAIDGIVSSCQSNFQKQSKKLASYFGDPELDISKQADFDTVQQNWADTVKRLFTESAVVTATKAHRLLDILNSGGFKTKYSSDGLKQSRFDTLFGLKHSTAAERKASEAEAPLSATLCSTDSDRMFQNKAFGTFGIIGIEWKKDSNNYAMAFSNCDVGTPGDMETDGATGYGRTFNPSLASNPSISSLAAFDNGIASNDFRLKDRIAATGYMTPSGHYMSSYCNAIKLLRHGQIQGDALDFDNAVNNAHLSPFKKPGKAPRAFGWNEVLLIGNGGIGDIGAIHFNTKAWTDQYNKEEAEIANGTWKPGESRPTQGEPNAKNYVANLIKSHGAMLKQNGIKIIVDGQEEKF